MKSQVNALLHVLEKGVLKDAQSTYPALRDSLAKDLARLALYSQSRGRGLFTLDLPHLESLLLRGLEEGRLVLSGPLSRAVSKKIRVPLLFSGLWLRIFERDACLKTEVDVTAVGFLRQFLVLGKKLRVECTQDRIDAVMGAYHDVEAKLRRPTLRWESDTLGLAEGDLKVFHRIGSEEGYLTSDGSGPESCTQDLLAGICHSSSFHRDNSRLLYGTPLHAEYSLDDGTFVGASRRSFIQKANVHLVQALDGSCFYSPQLPLFRKEICGDDRERLLEDERLLSQVQKVADLVSNALGIYDPMQFSAEEYRDSRGIGFKHGPGAVAEQQKNWEKSQFLNWPLKLDGTFPWELCVKTAFDTRDRPSYHEKASRLLAVPKTAKGPRLIAAEPTSHQWCQQLTWRWLRVNMKRLFGSDLIDFTNQQLSGNMVLRASKERDLATVDLSDASDRLSCWTVERMFRCNPSLLTALHAARTRYLRDTVSRDRSFLSLRKFASQGTATTFPIMSLVMLFIALGCCLDEEPSLAHIRKLRDQVRVFGDDIIIPVHGYDRLMRVMELLQLKINKAKSYVNGHFRESCGVDGYKGYDVTPVKPQHIIGDSPESCQAVIDTSNNLFMKGYWHASAACLDLLPLRIRRRIRIVGPNDSGFSGLVSFSGGDESHLETRWNSSLHRYEIRVWQLYSRARQRPREGHAALLDFFASKHSPFNSRTVSEYADVRKTRGGLLWEPANSRSLSAVGYQRKESRY